MSRWTRYIERAEELVTRYSGDTPLAPFLKDYFREHRQMGATDRRYVSDLVYDFYRLGHAVGTLSIPARLILGYYRCTAASGPLIDALKAEGVLDTDLSSVPFFPGDIFPWKSRLSAGIDGEAFSESHLRQPEVFIRVRPGYADLVRETLTQKGIRFGEAPPNGLALPPHTALQGVLPANQSYVVQDINSQKVGELMTEAFAGLGPKPSVWDCCAASGGKSILAKDLLPPVRLTVSDIRSSILHNLDKRFAEAGIRYERSFTADLSQPLRMPGVFDLVMADVPCSGSGTWARTPEQLYFFRETDIAGFAERQRSLLSNVLPAVRPGGFLLLITCSVFREENEDNVALLEKQGCRLVQQRLFAGYNDRADTLFGALLQKDA